MVKEIYKIILIENIDKIESCEKDYYNYFVNKFNVMRKNLEKCYDIIENVCILGKYLLGKLIVDILLLLDFYKD